MLMGFPYGKDFVYDEMVLTGPGEKGEANAKLVVAANAERWAARQDRSRARARRRKSATTGFTICCSSASPPTAARFASRSAAIAIPVTARRRR